MISPLFRSIGKFGYVGEYQKKVKLFFSLFLDNTPLVRIVPVFFEVY
jgi:hypothetical protein